ncbi:hypothetical protein N7509_006021 [Penicillium cosmopolitanum]|uniref:Uncharacterized protein n=1 Tax=Penicillium cosmopolitanum TaxID=1131564 RepID=A0A9X0BAM8_9EURO|nr:uncharacterized protein N7509_006021 [Penicillium cosmopolitanum]KAJ5397908.1 hypothetical protein N7509_006021 [Penicillium cosmopolitanum]
MSRHPIPPHPPPQIHPPTPSTLWTQPTPNKKLLTKDKPRILNRVAFKFPAFHSPPSLLTRTTQSPISPLHVLCRAGRPPSAVRRKSQPPRPEEGPNH